MNHRPLKFLLLDCDGVLVNSESIARCAEMEDLEKKGLALTVGEYQEITLGWSEKEHVDLVMERLHKSRIHVSRSVLEEDLRRARWSRYESDLVVMPGMKGLLERHAHQVAIVTSSDRDSLDRKLSLAGIKELLPSTHLFTSEQVQRGKPSPDLYKFAISKLRVEGESCLAIEDSGPGVESASAANIEVWGLTESDVSGSFKNSLIAAGASRVFDTPAGLVSAIEEIFAFGLTPKSI